MKVVSGLLRIPQWIKNSFLFIPIFFAGELFSPDKLLNVLLGAISFSLVASSIYILNDIRDIESDKKHPEKKFRPIPAGKVTVPVATFVMILCALAGFGLSWFLNPYFTYILLSYFILNLAYSMGLKRISILDLMIVATGFVLRVLAGGVVADVPISHWLIIMIFLLSLFIVLAKRRDDILEFNKSGVALRSSIENYNLDFIHSLLTMLSGIIVVSYLMYTISPEISERFGTDHLYFTTVFVIAGVFRYIQITLVENKSGSPTRILYTDRFLHVTLAGWVVSFFMIIYFLKAV
jgi:4-hydroxybenzoate polyprenyltransferase